MIIGQSLSPQHITETPAVSPLTSVALSVCLMRKYGAHKQTHAHKSTHTEGNRYTNILPFSHGIPHIAQSALYFRLHVDRG